MTPKEEAIVLRIPEMVILDALLMKGVLTYSEVQESIAAVRENIPREHYTPAIALFFDIMEQTWQNTGSYHSPLRRPGEP